eukprot:gene15152-6267_t
MRGAAAAPSPPRSERGRRVRGEASRRARAACAGTPRADARASRGRAADPPPRYRWSLYRVMPHARRPRGRRGDLGIDLRSTSPDPPNPVLVPRCTPANASELVLPLGDVFLALGISL